MSKDPVLVIAAITNHFSPFPILEKLTGNYCALVVVRSARIVQIVI